MSNVFFIETFKISLDKYMLSKKNDTERIVMKNILIVQITRLGDIVQTIPLLSDLKHIYPHCNIYMMINDIFHESKTLLENIQTIPVILEKFVTEDDGNFRCADNEYLQNIISSINKMPIDMVINLNNSPVAKHLLEKISCETKLGFGTQKSEKWASYNMAFLRTRTQSSINLVDIFRGFTMDKRKSHAEYIPHTQTENTHHDRDAIAIQCGARNKKRQFQFVHYVDIVEHYLNKNEKILLLGIDSEKEIAEQIIAHFHGHKNIENKVGQTNLMQLIDTIKTCKRIFTPDTGTMHIAALYDTPITTLFYGTAYPHETLAYTENIEVFMPKHENFPCYPCPEEFACPYSYKCHSFSFKKMLNDIDNHEFVKLKIERDEIGQCLTPMNEQAKLWRQFAKYYFLNITDEDIVYDDDTKNTITRELKLYKIIHSMDIDTATENFHLIKPLIYYKLLAKDDDMIEKAIQFLQTQGNAK